MFEESRASYFRCREDDDTANAAWPLSRLEQSAHAAGHAFGEPLLGTLEPGAPADLVVLDYGPPAPLDAGSLPGHWLFGLSARDVRDVMVAGEWVVRDRRLVHMEYDRIVAEARAEARRLWDRLESLGPHEFDPKGARWLQPVRGA
jgi:cytosine/adenosine deaminase-related metal-dependent hydrolase